LKKVHIYVKFKANLKGKCDHVSTFICRQLFLYFISITRRIAFEYLKTCHTTFFSHNLFLTQIEYEIIILKLYDIMMTRYSGGGRMIS
jgi:hypothetical protein